MIWHNISKSYPNFWYSLNFKPSNPRKFGLPECELPNYLKIRENWLDNFKLKSFNAWCPLKGHAYLNKPGVKGLKSVKNNVITLLRFYAIWKYVMTYEIT